MTNNRAGAGGGDKRRDPDAGLPEAATNNRVDRVFPATRPKPRDTAAQAAAALLATQRATTASDPGELEVSLRRQLSRLQRQLSEAQRELADKDDELAGESETRLQLTRAHQLLVDAHRKQSIHVEELAADHARTAGVEARLLECVTVAETLTHDLERESELRASAEARVAELGTAIEEARARWLTERATIDQQHADELTRMEARKRIALDQAEEAIAATTLRAREASETQLAELREAHERSLAGLRGELEPKALEAHKLQEQYERLTAELQALKSETARVVTERDAVSERERTSLNEAHASQLAVRERHHQIELARLQEEREAQGLALEQVKASAEQREQASAAAVASLHEAQKKLQVELAELKERSGRLDADNLSLEARLAAATEQTSLLTAEQHALRDQLEASDIDARRNELDRRRFVAYLEEGLALLGALPPTDVNRHQDGDREDAAQAIDADQLDGGGDASR